MKHFVTINPQGQFELEGARWYCNSVVYFAHYPGGMGNWFEEPWWPKNEAVLDRDFERMAQLGLNHAALFLSNTMFFDAGRPVEDGYRKMDRVVQAAKKNDIRLTLFCGPFIDNADEYRRITGKAWPCGDEWLPPFNDVLFDAYVQQMRPLAERYVEEPTVLGYADRIDRFHKGFDNVSIPHNLKEEWAAWLKARYGSLAALLEAKGGTLEGDPDDFDNVLLPQESKWNGSLNNPMAFDYILMQKKEVGDAQARWDAAMADFAPKQVFWTPFEGNTNTWAMLDGFSPETKKLQAVWMEYYFFEVVRTHPVQPFDEWTHTPEVIHRRLAHELPVVYNAAYMMTRYLKQSVQQPVVICHGAMHDNAVYGIETAEQQAAVIDRVNAACLNADGDGWHYWSWTDDYQSKSSHLPEQKQEPTAMYWYGESTGMYDWDDCPRPVTAVVCQYTTELRRRARRNGAAKRSDVLLLSSAPLNYNLFRRLAFPTAAALSGALSRCGVECDYLWTAQNDVPIAQETLDRYRLIVLADHMYRRDFRDMPDKLLRYVEQGGTLCFALDRWETLEDEHGVRFECDALRRLSGVDPEGAKHWPGAGDTCRNWPFGTNPAHEANMDAQAFPRLNWGVCPAFRHRAPYASRCQLLGWRSMDGDTFTLVDGLASAAEVIAVAKYPAGSRPWLWRHRIGKGMVYVNAWTNNLFRDSDRSIDYGGWDYDWLLALAIETSEAGDVNLLSGSGLWLRNEWGYFWEKPVRSNGVFTVSLYGGILMLLGTGLCSPAAQVHSLPRPPAATDLVVCLGDSITDGYTYGQIIMQALREAGKPVPPVVCAGVASDTASQMAARVEKTVLRFKPQLVTFNAGSNDALRNVSPEAYKQALRHIVASVRDQGANMILLTPCVILKRDGETEAEKEAFDAKVTATLDGYEAVIRSVAAENGLPVAENRARMQEDMRNGIVIMAEDGVHPNYAGQAAMARAILDAMGYASVTLPATFDPHPFPGIIAAWKMRLAPVDDKGHPIRLTTETAAALEPDPSWQTYTLPDPAPPAAPSAEDWLEQIRRNGYATRHETRIGKGLVQAVADIESDTERKAYVNTGIGASTVWLNEENIHVQGPAWTGFHAGKERIPVTLKPGRNRLIAEIEGQHFFISVTDELVWETLIR